MLGPSRQAFDAHGHAPDDEHWKEDGLTEGLHGGHVVGQHGNDQAEPEKGEGDKRERDPQVEEVVGKRHADPHRQDDLEHGRRDQNDVAGRQRTQNELKRGDRRDAVAPPYAALALAHHGGRKAEACAAQGRNREQLAHMLHEGDGLVAVEYPEGDQEDCGE